LKFGVKTRINKNNSSSLILTNLELQFEPMQQLLAHPIVTFGLQPLVLTPSPALQLKCKKTLPKPGPVGVGYQKFNLKIKIKICKKYKNIKNIKITKPSTAPASLALWLTEPGSCSCRGVQLNKEK
jgi:hypothetical protein